MKWLEYSDGDQDGPAQASEITTEEYANRVAQTYGYTAGGIGLSALSAIALSRTRLPLLLASPTGALACLPVILGEITGCMLTR